MSNVACKINPLPPKNVPVTETAKPSLKGIQEERNPDIIK
jgi:hypothetical protein